MSDLLGTAGGLWTNKQNQEFAEEMASTQYQRAMADMKAAGLNPTAVFGSGGGSPSAAPGGQMENPVSGGEGLMASAKSAVEIQQNLANKELSEATAAKAKAETANTKEATEVTKAAAITGRANAKLAANAADISDKETSAKKIVIDSPQGKFLHGLETYGLGPIKALVGAGSLAGRGIASMWGGDATAKQAAQAAAERKEERQRDDRRYILERHDKKEATKFERNKEMGKTRKHVATQWRERQGY